MKGLFQCPPRASPWVFMDAKLSPCKGKSFQIPSNIQSFCPYRGALLIAIIPRAMPWARSFWAFSPYLNHMRNFSPFLKRKGKKNPDKEQESVSIGKKGEYY